MTKRKYYAVKIGKLPGIYCTWSETEKQVKGFPGAIYKSFTTKEEAIKYISCQEVEENTNESDETLVINKKIEQEINNLEEGDVIAFVDGSYSPNADGVEKYSFGVVLLTNTSEDFLYKAIIDKTNMKSRNVSGEIEGVKQAILWAIENKKQKIKIYYDYEGVEKWATKEWKAKSDVSHEYSKFFDDKSKLISIEFEHIKSHTGIVYNEKADELAKKALLSQGYKTYVDGSIYFIGFQKNDWINIIESLNNEINEEDIKNKIKVEESKPKDYSDKLLLTLKNQRVTINCYKGNKSYVQGKQSLLFQRIIALAIEQLPTENAVIEVLNTYHALEVKKSEVENAFSIVLPNFPINENDIKLRNTLLSAVFNTLIVGYMPDYTCLITPLLRAMEFYLHRILSDRLQKVTTNSNGSNRFNYFRINNSTHLYEYSSSAGSLRNEQIEYLNDLYNRYNRIRHPYSHWSEDSMDTQVITDIKIAHDLILEGLQFIDKYYTLFK